MTREDRERELYEELRAPSDSGGCGILLAAISRGYLSSPVRVVFTCRPTPPFTLTLRIASRSFKRGLNMVDIGMSSLEELRDAIDDAIARRDEITRELTSLAPASAPRPLRPERFATDPSTDARSASRASVEGPLFLGDDADEDADR